MPKLNAIKKFILAKKLEEKGSVISSLGKGIVILGRAIFILSLLLFIILVAIMPFFPTGGASGVPVGFGVFAWLFFEIIGSIIFYLGNIGFKKINL